MRGGLPGKLGDRFEVADVVQALVEVLCGRATQATWEKPAAGHGIDVVMETAEVVWGIQLKRRMSSCLSAKDLREIRAYAMEWIERSPRHRYRLRTDTAVGPLQRVCEIAALTASESWWDAITSDPPMQQEASAWGDLSMPDGRMQVHGHLRRISVEIMDEALTRRSTLRELAQAGMAQPEHAAAFLEHFAWRHMGITMEHGALRAALHDAGLAIGLAQQPDDPSAGLLQCAEGWCAEMDRARGPLESMPRTATGQALTAIGDRPRLIAIHGPAGCGKTQVLVSVVRGLIVRGTVPLVVDCARLDPSRWCEDLGLGADPLAALVRAAGARPAVLVIDQIDQALWSGRGPALVVLQRLIEGARRFGCTVVAGCRSVDCRDSRLAPLLTGFTTPGSGRPDDEIEVGDLAATEVEAQLVASGIAPSELDPVLLPLLGRPLLLRLVLDVAQQHGSALPGVRGALDLIRRWKANVAEGLARANHVEAARRIERRLVDAAINQGMARILIERIDPTDTAAMLALIEAGMVVRSGDGRWIGWTHQVLLDHAVVFRWVERMDGGESLTTLIGPRVAQDLATAARLRLLVGMISLDLPSRTALDELMCSDGLRPMCRFAVLRGLASLETDGERESWTSSVLSWLGNAHLARVVTRDLLAGQPGWMQECEAWLATGGHAADLRPTIIAALGAVATTWGDGVTRVLRSWEQYDSELLSEANQVFWHDPAADSDALFILRLERIRQKPQLAEPPCDWAELLQQNPRRMATLLATIIPHLTAETWHHSRALWGLAQCPVEAAAAAGRHFIDPLLASWRDLDLPEWGMGGDGPIWHLIELLGAACGGAAAARELSWPELRTILPDRWQDDLVRVVALDHWHEAPADAAFQWMTSTPATWAAPRTQGDPWRWAEAAIRRHALRSDQTALDAFQHALCTQPDPRRFRGAGATATFLLAAIPEASRTTDATTWLETHRTILAQDRSDFDPVQGGSVRSDIDDVTAAAMDDAAWQARIDAIYGKESSWQKAGPGRFLAGSVRHYAWQLHEVVSRDPRRGLPLLTRFTHPRYDEVRSSVAEGVLNRTRSVPVDGWTATERTAVAVEMVLRGWRCCDRAVATYVGSGEGGPWPEAVIDLLLTMVNPQVDGEDTPALAWYGLESIARAQAEHLPRIWSTVQALPNQVEKPRLAALRIRLAHACMPIDHTGCVGSIRHLASDPAATMSPESLPILLRLVYDNADRELIGRLCTALDSPDAAVRRQAGGVIIALTCAGIATPETWNEAVARGCHDIQRGMAAAVLDILRGSPTDWDQPDQWPQAILDCCLALGACDDDETLRSIAGIWYTRPGTVWDSRSAVRRLFEAPGFLAACAGSRAVARDPEPLLTACEQFGDLLPVLPVIAAAVTGACASPPDAGRGWSNGESIMRVAARCLEEAQARGTQDQRQLVMDLWDLLVDRAWPGMDGRVTALLAR